MATNRLSLDRSRRVRNGRDFKRIYRFGRRQHHAILSMVLFSDKKNPHRETTRLGLSVSRKVGPAVVRNRIKRRLREIFRIHRASLAQGLDLVVIPRASASRATYQTLESVFLDLCRKGKARAGE